MDSRKDIERSEGRGLCGEEKEVEEKKEMMCRAPVEGGCGRKAGFSGYCPAHYWRLRHGKDMTTPITGWANKSGCGTCISCGKKMARLAAKGLCEACYQRARRLKMREISGGKLISVKEMKAKGIDGEFRNAVGKVLEKNGMKVPAVYQGHPFQSIDISKFSKPIECIVGGRAERKN